MDFYGDLRQAGLLLLLRIKIDRILSFSPLSLSQKNCVRRNREDFIIGMAPWRVWLYLKVSRNLPKFSPTDFGLQLAPLEVEGIEDGFVECEFSFSFFSFSVLFLFITTVVVHLITSPANRLTSIVLARYPEQSEDLRRGMFLSAMT